MIEIVSGVTGAGKSTYIERQLLADERVVFPYDLRRAGLGASRLLAGSKVYFHFNTLRSNWAQEPNPDFCWNDQIWRSIAGRADIVAATVMTASPSELIARARRRTAVEPRLGRHGAGYDSDIWIDALRKVDLARLHEAWLVELQRLVVPIRVIDTSDVAVATR